MGIEECFPLGWPVWGRFDTFGLKNAGDGCVGNIVAKIREGSSNTGVAPSRILTGKLNDEFGDFVSRFRSPGVISSAVTVIPFFSNVAPMVINQTTFT